MAAGHREDRIGAAHRDPRHDRQHGRQHLAGGCKSMFGSGVIAFEPAALQWVAPDGHEELLDNVAYRANGAEVIVLTKDAGAVPSLVFGFPDHDRAVVAFFNCTMNRVGAKSPTAGASATGALASATPSGPANAVLELQVDVGRRPTPVRSPRRNCGSRGQSGQCAGRAQASAADANMPWASSSMRIAAVPPTACATGTR